MHASFVRPGRGALIGLIAAGTLASGSVAHAGAIAAVSAPAGVQLKPTPDSDMQSVLDALKGLGGKPIETLDVATARNQPTIADAVKKVQKGPDPAVAQIKAIDRDIPGAVGALLARIYTPAGSGPFPVVVYFHGGGWVLADKQVYDAGARGLAAAADAVVISVDYRRAPEAKFPAAWDDALAAYKWAATNATSIHGDPQKLGLAGESAGGNLAVATAIAAKHAGLTPPKAVLAVYPVAQTDDMSSPSYVDSADAAPLDKAMISWFVDKLFSNPAQKTDPRVDLVKADLSGLPPVTIINAQIDPLRDDGATLQAALQKAGVKVDRKVYSGVTHEFFGTGSVVPKARQAQRYAGERLKAAFGN